MDEINGTNEIGVTSEVGGADQVNTPMEQHQTTPAEVQQIMLDPAEIQKLNGWAKFVAIMKIIGGALSCLGIITAAYGIPLIISGIKLLNATDDLRIYTAYKEPQAMVNAFDNLQKHFKLTGISYIVSICFSILFIVLYIVFLAFVISNMDSFNTFSIDLWLTR